MQTLLKTTQAYRLLQTECEEERFSHAYLVLFNDGRNLRNVLKSFAKLILNCADEETAAKKRVSELIDDENFSDCLFYPAEGKKLSVEDAEKIQEESTLNPVEGDKKVFILSDFAEANVQTQNKLLKLLEEPPKGVYFLLGATTVFPVLSTVLSRTKKLEILPFTPDEIAECLTRVYGEKYDEKTLLLCAAAANGSVGEAQNIVEGGFHKTLLDSAFSLALAKKTQLPTLVKQIGETKRQKELIGLLRILFRDALLLKMQKKTGRNPDRHLLLFSEKQRLEEIAATYTPAALLYAQEAFGEAEKQIKFNAVFPQCIELCIANILEKNQA